MQTLQLVLGTIEGIAQRKIDIFVSRPVHMKTVGMDLCAGHGKVNFDHVARPAVVAVARTFEGHVTLHDPLTETFQPLSQRARALLERARTFDMTEG
jgi:hypothetical protein